MSRQGDDTYSGTMPLGIVHVGFLAVPPRGRDGGQNTFRISFTRIRLWPNERMSR